MSNTPQDLPTLTDAERDAHDGLEGPGARSVTVNNTERAAIVSSLEELDAYRQAAREAQYVPVAIAGDRPGGLAAVRGLRAFRKAVAAAGITAGQASAPEEPTWEQAADAVAGRLRALAVDIGPDVGWGDDDHLDASAMRHLAAVLPMLEERAGTVPAATAVESALADVLVEARAVVATIARNGITGDHLTGRLEPLRDAIRDLDRALEALPPAR